MWLDVSRSRRSAAACKPLSLAPAIPLADERGVAALAEGELMRYLAEAAWYPTALLPSQGAQSEPVDADSTRATLTAGVGRQSKCDSRHSVATGLAQPVGEAMVDAMAVQPARMGQASTTPMVSDVAVNCRWQRGAEGW